MGHAVHPPQRNWFAGVCFTNGLVGIFARTCGCGFFTQIFRCGFLGADFFLRFLGADFVADFVMACADFGVRIFFCGFYGLFSRRKSPEKSHQKLPPKNPHQRSSPRNVFLTVHHHTPSGKTQQISSGRLGSRCTLWRTAFFAQMASVRADERVISIHVSSPDVKNDAAPKWANNSLKNMMGRAIHALTGRTARHETPKKYFFFWGGGGQQFPKKSSDGVLLPNNGTPPQKKDT